QRLSGGQARAAHGAQLLPGIVQAEQVGHEAADSRAVRLVETLADEALEGLALDVAGPCQAEAGARLGIAAERQRKTGVPIGMTHGTPPLVCSEGEYRQRVLMNPEAALPVSAQPYSTSNSPAAPMPPPTHMVITTYFTPRRLPSSRAWPTMRAPLMP